jgi:hypothetical protein
MTAYRGIVTAPFGPTRPAPRLGDRHNTGGLRAVAVSAWRGQRKKGGSG